MRTALALALVLLMGCGDVERVEPERWPCQAGAAVEVWYDCYYESCGGCSLRTFEHVLVCADGDVLDAEAVLRARVGDLDYLVCEHL